MFKRETVWMDVRGDLVIVVEAHLFGVGLQIDEDRVFPLIQSETEKFIYFLGGVETLMSAKFGGIQYLGEL